MLQRSTTQPISLLHLFLTCAVSLNRPRLFIFSWHHATETSSDVRCIYTTLFSTSNCHRRTLRLPMSYGSTKPKCSLNIKTHLSPSQWNQTRPGQCQGQGQGRHGVHWTWNSCQHGLVQLTGCAKINDAHALRLTCWTDNRAWWCSL